MVAYRPGDLDAWKRAWRIRRVRLPPPSTLDRAAARGLLFGLGMSLLVAPLTTGLMNSVPVRNAGLGSAINNSLSRVGSPIPAAVFILMNGSFYSALARDVPGRTRLGELRSTYQALNPPPRTATGARRCSPGASTDAFHLAVIVCAVLLVAGALVNLFGLRSEEAGAPKAASGDATDRST